MAKIPVDPRFFAPRSDRYDVALLGHRDRRRCEIFFLLSLIAKLDPAVRFERNLFICTGPDLDRSELHVDYQFSAGRYIDLLREIFFRRN